MCKMFQNNIQVELPVLQLSFSSVEIYLLLSTIIGEIKMIITITIVTVTDIQGGSKSKLLYCDRYLNG